MNTSKELESYIDSLNLRFFKGREFTWLWTRKTPLGVKNSVPPKKIWENIVQTLVVLDRARELLGVPVTITSAYRSPAYNAAVGGARFSQHLVFNALDVIPRGKTPAHLAAVIRGLRSRRFVHPITKSRFTFRGGVGSYRSFVHIDTRGHDADW